MAMYTEKELDGLAEYYDTTDVSDELDSDEAEFVETAVPDPMITMSLRMPKHIVDRVRAMAEERGVKPTQLMREWVETHVADDESFEEATVPASALYAFLAEHAQVPAGERPPVKLHDSNNGNELETR